MHRILTIIVASGLLVPAAVTSAPDTSAQHWKLSWSDEFNGPDGAPPDLAKWDIVTGGGGFGNKELEQYTARPENVRQEHGNLVITARHESFTGADGIQRDYTSARLNSKGKFEQKYGRFEARIKIPQGQGMWPAFWLLGNDSKTAGWPMCGEIDIMENVGYEPGKIHGSMHGPG
jgi:beta-glucanase (GH16 family)